MTRIAEGVHRLGSSLINFYLVEEGDRLTVVDAGLPGYRKRLDAALAELGRSLQDVEAIVLTHGHSDHVGFAEGVRSEAGVPVYIHQADEQLALTGKPARGERGPVPYLWRPQLWRLLAHGIPNGGLPAEVAEVTTFGDDATLDVPGRPSVVPTCARRTRSPAATGRRSCPAPSRLTSSGPSTPSGGSSRCPWTAGPKSAVARARELGPS